MKTREIDLSTLPASVRTYRQRLKFGPKVFTENGKTFRIIADVRHDDDCKNGHNSFSITGTIDRKSGNGVWVDYMGGCIHDEVAKHFPKLAPFIKWHLTSTDGPMYYLANTLFHASQRDCWGRLKGEVSSTVKTIRVGNSPIVHQFKSEKFWQWLKDQHEAACYIFGIEEVPHKPPTPPDTYQFKPKYTFAGYIDNPKWHECPFDSLAEAQQWQEAFSFSGSNGALVLFEEMPISYSDGKERNLDHARSCAVWPDATDEELTAPDLEQKLIDRLPALMVEFKAAVESLGLVY